MVAHIVARPAPGADAGTAMLMFSIPIVDFECPWCQVAVTEPYYGPWELPRPDAGQCRRPRP